MGRILFVGWIEGLGKIAYWKNTLVGPVELIEHSIILDELWRAHNIYIKTIAKKIVWKKIGCLIFDRRFETGRGVFRQK